MPSLLSPSFSSDLLSSLTLGLVLLGIVQLSIGCISRNSSLDAQRVWRSTFRHGGALLFVLGLGVIWEAELREVLLALGAATAGVLVAFREVWLSLWAFWMRVVKRPFGLGDFIEVDGIRGMVLDITWQHIVLAETGPGASSLNYTGRVVQVPNNRILVSSVFVENLTGGQFGVHTFSIPLPQDTDTLAAEDRLLWVAQAACAEFQEDAKHYMQQLRNDEGVDTPNVEPCTQLRFDEDGKVILTLRLVVPLKDRQRIEQHIIRGFLQG